MSKVRVKENVRFAFGGIHVVDLKKGIMDLPDSRAAELIQAGYADPVEEKEEKSRGEAPRNKARGGAPQNKSEE